MSFYFYVKRTRDITAKELLYRLPNSKVEIAYAQHVDVDAALNKYITLYIPNDSTRGIGINAKAEEYEIGINVLSTKEDYLLATQIAISLAKMNETGITPETEEYPLDIAVFEKQYNDDWAETNKTQGARVVEHLIQKDNSIISLGGCLRSYHIGPKILEKFLKDQPDELALYEKIIDNIKEVQFLDETTIRVPNLFQANEKNGEPWQYIVLIPEEKQFLLKTDFVILNEHDNIYKVPFEEIKKWAEEKQFERLDEEQFIVPAISKEEFTDLMKRFGYEDPHQITDKEMQTDSAKSGKWWAFWK